MKKIGFFVTLPRGTVREIRRRAKLWRQPLWAVVDEAIDAPIGGPRRKARGKR